MFRQNADINIDEKIIQYTRNKNLFLIKGKVRILLKESKKNLKKRNRKIFSA